jgi:hypothetical protein
MLDSLLPESNPRDNLLTPLVQDFIERRDHDECQDRRRDDAADYRAAKRRTEVSAFT